jgi:hypothetical protein
MVRDWSIVDIDSSICTELPHSKLGSVVSDYIIGVSKPVHDISDEFHGLSIRYGSCRLYFDPFGELMHRYQDLCESTFSFLEWTYQI